jgi:predicted lysophospholipase L1 biosynthesis ABC-type transport system permease subunit
VTRARAALPNDVEAVFEPTRASPIRDAAGVAAWGLWLFAGVTFVAGAFVCGQVISRQVAAGAEDAPALRALGFTRRDRVFDRVVPVLPVACASAVLAVAGAYVASSTMPLGDAARADPESGRSFDPLVLGVGSAVTLVLVLAIALVSAARQERARAVSDSRPRAWVAERAAGLGASTPAVTGLGLAFDRGQGRASAAARSALLGCAAGTMGVVAVLGFGAALTHLFDAPQLYGWGSIDVADLDPGRVDAIREVPGVAEVGIATLHADLRVEGTPVPGMSVLSVIGRASPSIVTGRSPTAPDEVALGPDTHDDVGAAIGDTVLVEGTAGGARLRVVGTVAFPATNDAWPIAEGALVVHSTMQRLGPGKGSQEMVVVGLDDSADRAATIDRLEAANGGPLALPDAPPEVDKLHQVDRLPRVLAVLLAVLAALATAHALFVGVRRRRRDLVVLRVLGLAPRQVRGAVTWQAAVLVVAGALVGIPLGIVVGRAAWNLTAEAIGVLGVYRLPAVTMVAVLPATLLVAIALALQPARRASRLRPATILRSE